MTVEVGDVVLTRTGLRIRVRAVEGPRYRGTV